MITTRQKIVKIIKINSFHPNYDILGSSGDGRIG